MKSKSLVHPIYLDTSMLLSFLAALQNGVTLQREITETSESHTGKSVEASVQGNTTEVLQVLGLKLGIDGDGTLESSKGSDTQSRFVMQHSFASLFNVLLSTLKSEKLVTGLTNKKSLSGIGPGDIVEFEAAIHDNPTDVLIRTLNTWVQMKPLFLPDQNGKSHAAKRRQNRPAQDPSSIEMQETFKLLELLINLLNNDMTASTLTDLVGKSEKPRFHSIIAVDRDHFTDTSRASIVDGKYKVLGKVISVEESPEQSISLGRRGTILRMVENADESSFTDLFDAVHLVLPDQISALSVQGPYLQILPIAIYV
ncbi:DUF6414 family protein [Corynebacterium pseudogenitalium]|uniref:DUF6414 family protein n=1 Tax=Corynebacterium pseudogenitalium TaxID=38303 RepID=UPI00210AC1B9|nr:hypothetical protein [Corynebacterium pseudogenitalium]MCQ4607503.1 hypothetical protein [Corynebacterium pseudogenitalium]